MNKQRRKSLKEIQLESLAWDLERLKEEEDEYRDNMPENLQASNRYQRTDEVCDLLQEALDGLECASQNIAEVLEW